MQWRRKMFLSRGAESKQVKTHVTLCAHSARKLGGSGGMHPQENFGGLDLRAFLVHFRGHSGLLACHM